MKKYFFALLMLCLWACDKNKNKEVPYAASGFINQEWAMNKLWEDGQAEVAIYDAEMIIYGVARQFQNPMITVKEEFNQAFNVKTDDYRRNDLFSVMKVNRFADIETPNYPYHYLTSLFIKRDKPEQLYKMTHSGQEWCGNTFKQFELTSKGYDYDYNSYFDGYGDGKMTLSGNQSWWEDQLPYLLRTLNFEEGLKFEKEVYVSQINTKTQTPQKQSGQFSVIDRGDLWEVLIEFEDGKNSYLFEKEYPNVMVNQNTRYGYHMKLKRVSRYKYWR